MKTFSQLVVKITILSFLATMVVPALLPAFEAHAQASGTTVTADGNDNALSRTMCNAIEIVTGSAGKGLAAIAIISMGIGFFTGKISWGLMIGLAMGIAAMFGAPTIVSALSGEGTLDCTSTGN